MLNRSNSSGFLRLLSVLAILMAGGSACGSGGGTTEQDPGNQSAGDRWTATGDYNYDIDDNGCDTGNQNFTSQRDYCLGLEDDALNNYCGLEARAASYAQDCGDDFQENNSAPEPQPEPTPQPTVTIPYPVPAPLPVPAPSPSPSDYSTDVQIVRDLHKNGIEVQIANPIYDAPGEPNARDYLPAFWDTLLSVEYQILARKNLIRTITISTYVVYSPLDQNLTLSGAMTAEDIGRFFSLFDRLENLQQTSGVSIDTNILLFDSTQSSFDRLTKEIVTLEKALPTLIPAVKKIVFGLGSYADFQIEQRLLTVGGDTYPTDLDHFSLELKSAQPFFKMLDGLSMTVTDAVFGFDQELPAFNSLVTLLLNEKVSVATLAEAGVLSSVAISIETQFYPSIKELSLDKSASAAAALPGILEALAWQTKFSQASKIKFDYTGDSLDAKFVQASRNLMQVADMVRAHPRIVQILFGAKSELLSSSLVVGSDDTVADLQQLILSAN